MQSRSNPIAKYGVAVALCLLFVTLAMAQVESTRVSSYDWQCTDEAGTKISDHQRFDTAFVACLNAPNGAYVQGGRYRISRPAAPVAGQAHLSWTSPTANTDGTALTDLAGYRVSYGASAAELTQTIQLPDAGARTFVIKDLAPGTYYFAIRAYTSGGNESAPSNVASKVVM